MQSHPRLGEHNRPISPPRQEEGAFDLAADLSPFRAGGVIVQSLRSSPRCIAPCRGGACWHDIAGGLSKAQRREIDSAAAAAAMEALAQLGVGVVEHNKRGTPMYRATGDLP